MVSSAAARVGRVARGGVRGEGGWRRRARAVGRAAAVGGRARAVGAQRRRRVRAGRGRRRGVAQGKMGLRPRQRTGKLGFRPLPRAEIDPRQRFLIFFYKILCCLWPSAKTPLPRVMFALGKENFFLDF